MLKFNLNYWSVLVAVVINMVIGGLWYSPVLFGALWLKLKKLKKEDIKGQSTAMIFAVVSAILSSFGLAVVLASFGPQTISQALMIALVLLIGFEASTGLLEVGFENKNFGVWILNFSCLLVTFAANTVLLFYWK